MNRPLLIPQTTETHCGKWNTESLLWRYLIICSLPSKWFCMGPQGWAEEHSLHYLDEQSLRNPCVFGPEESTGLKISPQDSALFVSSVIPLTMLISQTPGSAVKVWVSIQEYSIHTFAGMLPSYGWRERWLSMKELSKLLMLKDEWTYVRSALLDNCHC